MGVNTRPENCCPFLLPCSAALFLTCGSRGWGPTAAGEPVRIVVEGLPEIRGATLLEKRAYCKASLDHIRTRLMLEPRGHVDMYGM